MFEDIFNENPILEDVPRKNFNQLDSSAIEKLQKNLINVDETVKNLEQWYKGEERNFHFLSLREVL